MIILKCKYLVKTKYLIAQTQFVIFQVLIKEMNI